MGFIALTEHRSTGRLTVPLQVLEYQCRRLEREGVRTKRPPIAAVVISHGEPRRIPTSFEDTIDLRGPLADLLPFVPRMRYLVVDASRLSEQDIARMMLPAAAHVLMHLFRDGRSRAVPRTLVRVADRLTALLDDAREAVVVQLLRYAARLTHPEDERALRTALQRIRSTREDTMRNMDEVLYDEGIEKGIEKGIERGIEKGIERGIERGIEKGIERGIDKGIELGREQARREMLTWLLTERFGALPAHVVERIATASVDRLDAWRGRVLAASSLADVLDA